jgi:hypothetical protein
MDDKIRVTVRDPKTHNAVTTSYNKMSDVSDGYHTFGELYQIRMLYNAAFFNELMKNPMMVKRRGDIVKSWKHSDGKPCFDKENYFVVVAQLPTGQISNHYSGKYWDLFKIPEAERAPEWDGHTAQEAADRLAKYLAGDF